MANYVKFLRGTVTAYNNLANKDKDTLYFVTEDKDSTTGKLYLGSVELSGSINESGITGYLSKLKDVDTSGAVQNNILGFNGTKWVSMDVNALVQVSVMGGANADIAGTAGLVPAPAAGEEDYFLRGDGSWAPITKHSVQIFEIELNENEAHEDAIVRAVGEANPVVGDFVIIKNANERISYIYNGIAWIALNNEYLTYINELQESINDITDVLTGDNGLQNQIDNLQSKLTQDVENLNTAVENKADEADLETLREALENKAEKSDLDNKANVNDTYTKQEVNTAIATAVSAADHLKRKIVNEYADIQRYIEEHADADQYIFMVPTIYQYMSESNKYDEYIVLKSDNDTYTIEPVGSWSVSLEDYVSNTELNNILQNYSTTTEVANNYYNKTDVDVALSTKVDKVYYNVPVVDENGDPVYEEDGVTPKIEEVEGTLLSPDDKKKLDALVIGEEGVEISGKVNAANVEGLSEWITTSRDKVAGLYSTTTDSKVNKAIADLATLTTAVDTNTTNITAVNTRVDDVITSLTAYVQSIEYNAKMAAIDTDIDTLKDALTWKVIATE